MKTEDWLKMNSLILDTGDTIDDIARLYGIIKSYSLFMRDGDDSMREDIVRSIKIVVGLLDNAINKLKETVSRNES